MPPEDEFSDAFDLLLELETGCRRDGVPEDWVEPLFYEAHRLIYAKRDIEKVYEIMERICDIWEQFSE